MPSKTLYLYYSWTITSSTQYPANTKNYFLLCTMLTSLNTNQVSSVFCWHTYSLCPLSIYLRCSVYWWHFNLKVDCYYFISNDRLYLIRLKNITPFLFKTLFITFGNSFVCLNHTVKVILTVLLKIQYKQLSQVKKLNIVFLKVVVKSIQPNIFRMQNNTNPDCVTDQGDAVGGRSTDGGGNMESTTTAQAAGLQPAHVHDRLAAYPLLSNR